MKIAVAQIEVVPGRPDKNLKTCLAAQSRAFSMGADAAVFATSSDPQSLDPNSVDVSVVCP